MVINAEWVANKREKCENISEAFVGFFVLFIFGFSSFNSFSSEKNHFFLLQWKYNWSFDFV